MVSKNSRALKSLVKKLSAVRTTLTKTEREILDQMVFSINAEASGHKASVTATATPKPSARMMSRKAMAKSVGNAEVTGHKLSIEFAKTPAPTPQPSARASAVGQITYDEASKTYMVK